jgi:hypothetical protein
VVITGRVVEGVAGEPARTRVVLHRVASDGSGQPIDSARTDLRGAYRLTIPHPDSTAIYVVSSWRAGVAYFSEAVRSGRRAAVDLRPLYVYDTSSAGPAIALTRRLVTVARQKRDGARDVLEVVELENPGRATRVSPDTLRPTWAGAIPNAAIQFQVGQGDISADAVRRRGDSVAAFGPFPPRDMKQLSYTYVLPADVRHVSVPIDQSTAELDLLLEDTTAIVTATRLDSLGTESVEGRRFARYRTPRLAAGAPVAIAFPERPLGPETLVPWVVAVAALALGAGLVVALRRKPPTLARGAAEA